MSKNIKTALYDIHVEMGAKIIPFAGYEMPVTYPNGIQAEHQAVRNSSGMFDVSHMGEFWITGEGALDFLQYMTINNVSKLEVGDAQYSAMCYDDGGIVDDLILYRKLDGYFMVVNASNIDKDLKWLTEHKPETVNIENYSEKYSLVALQGPQSRNVLSKFTSTDLNLKFYSYVDAIICGHSVMLSRTGYTGELGFEIYASNEAIIDIWSAFNNVGVTPCGLASRDILRMEMKYCLYGNDIDHTTNPIEAGLGWITDLSKNNFIGKSILLSVKEKTPIRRLVTFALNERGIPRHDYRIQVDGSDVGFVTSGTQSMSLSKGIGMAYINKGYATEGSDIDVIIRNKPISATIVKPPFVKETSILD